MNATMKVRQSGVAVITLDCVGESVNLLSAAVMHELDGLFERAAADASLKGLIIVSGKEKSFVHGANINEIQQLFRGTEQQAYEAARGFRSVFEKLEKLPFPTLVAIRGICVGGGLEMSLAAKFRIAAKKGTQVGLPEVNLGVIPGGGGSTRLPELVGPVTALEMILPMPPRPLDATTAWKKGVIDEVLDSSDTEELIARGEEIVLGASPKRYNPGLKARLLKWALEGNFIGRGMVGKKAYARMMKVSGGHYPALKEALKVVMLSASGEDRDKVFEAESKAFARCAKTKVSRNMISVFWAMQNARKTTGEVAPAPIRKVGVVGAGVMGHQIAQACAHADFDQIVLWDLNEELVSKGMKLIAGLFQELVEKRKLTREEADAKLAKIKPTWSYADFDGCDVVIEAVAEKLELKRKVFASLRANIKNPFFFFSNTSSLRIRDIAEGADNVAGVHFFNPIKSMKLVEVVRGKDSSQLAVDTATAFATALGKTTVVTADTPGFVVNHVLAAYLTEAIRLMEEGVSWEQIDKAMRKWGMPMGPIELMDSVGLDICGEVVKSMHAGYGDRLAAPRMLATIDRVREDIKKLEKSLPKEQLPQEVAKVLQSVGAAFVGPGKIDEVERARMLGKKGGAGIYLWNEDGEIVGRNPVVERMLAVEPIKVEDEFIVKRLSLITMNEAVRCLDEGVAADAQTLDLAMLLGTGFPYYSGGPIRMIDQLGARSVFQSLTDMATRYGENYVAAAGIKEKAEKDETFYAA